MKIVKAENFNPLKADRSSGYLMRKLEQLQVRDCLVIPPEDQSMQFTSLRSYVSSVQSRLRMTLRVTKQGDDFHVTRYQ